LAKKDTTLSSPTVYYNRKCPGGLFYGMQDLLQLLPKEIESKTALMSHGQFPRLKLLIIRVLDGEALCSMSAGIFSTKEELNSTSTAGKI